MNLLDQIEMYEPEPEKIRDMPEIRSTSLAGKMAEEAGYLPSSEVRAGSEDRSKAMNTITQAHAEGRLTDAQYQARMQHICMVASKRDLTTICNDLPRVQASGNNRKLLKIHALYVSLLSLVTTAVVLSWFLTEKYIHPINTSTWVAFPPVLTVVGIFSIIGLIVMWANAYVDQRARDKG